MSSPLVAFPGGAISDCLAGELSDSEVDSLVVEGKPFASWLYVNADDARCAEHRTKATAASISFECIEINVDALTVELADKVAAALSGMPKPVLIQCKTANRAGAALILSIAKQRGYNFRAAMQLAVDMELKFAAGFPLVPPVDGAPASAEWNVLVDSSILATSHRPARRPRRHHRRQRQCRRRRPRNWRPAQPGRRPWQHPVRDGGAVRLQHLYMLSIASRHLSQPAISPFYSQSQY